MTKIKPIPLPFSPTAQFKPKVRRIKPLKRPAVVPKMSQAEGMVAKGNECATALSYNKSTEDNFSNIFSQHRQFATNHPRSTLNNVTTMAFTRSKNRLRKLVSPTQNKKVGSQSNEMRADTESLGTENIVNLACSDIAKMAEVTPVTPNVEA